MQSSSPFLNMLTHTADTHSLTFFFAPQVEVQGNDPYTSNPSRGHYRLQVSILEQLLFTLKRTDWQPGHGSSGSGAGVGLNALNTGCGIAAGSHGTGGVGVQRGCGRAEEGVGGRRFISCLSHFLPFQ